ncbi:MAG: hypothetical protein C0423_01625 [Methylibium sp.]|nr:hypothetical protein [Methylibium sp.]
MDTGAVIELLGRDGQVRMVHKLQGWPCSIGRSPACDMVLDDAHLAGQHARIELDENGVARLLLLPSLNGAAVGRRKFEAGAALTLEPGAVFQIGASSLRLRRAADPLPPELALLPEAGPQRKVLLPALLLLWLGLLWFDQWSALNPGSPWIQYSGAVLGPLAVLLLWAAGWALLTQLFQHRFPFVAHLWRALLSVAGLHVLTFGLPVLAYAFSAPRLLVLDALLFPLGLAAMLWWHAVLVWPRARRALVWGLGGLLFAALLLMAARKQDQQHLFGPLYLSTLPPPEWRMVQPKPPEALIESLRPLEAELARKAAKDETDEPAESD